MVFGVTLGLIAGYFGGIVDSTIMGVAEVQLAFPFILLAITIVSITRPGYRPLWLSWRYRHGWCTPV